jgi:hypothetical protein
MHVRLTRKLANKVDGIDLSRWKVGDVIEMPSRDALMLVAEGWAELLERRELGPAGQHSRPLAADWRAARKRRR